MWRGERRGQATGRYRYSPTDKSRKKKMRMVGCWSYQRWRARRVREVVRRPLVRRRSRERREVGRWMKMSRWRKEMDVFRSAGILPKKATKVMNEMPRMTAAIIAMVPMVPAVP